MSQASLPRELLRVELEIQDPSIWTGFESAWDYDVWGGTDPDVVWAEEGGWVDVTCDTRGFVIERGRQTIWDDLQAAHIELELDNSHGRYSVYGSLSWPRIRPGFGIRVTGIWDGIEHPLFVGALSEYLEGQVPDDYKVVLRGYDSFRSLADPISVEYNPGVPAEPCGSRINRLLDAGLYDGPRLISSGHATMTNYKTTRTLLDEIQVTAMSDGGVVFVDNDGTFMYMGQERVFGRPRQIVTPPYISIHGYLDPTIGTVTAPSPTNVLPNQFTVITDADMGSTENDTLVSQQGSGTSQWLMYTTGGNAVVFNMGGIYLIGTFPTTPAVVACSVTLNDGTNSRLVVRQKNADGTWTQIASVSAAPITLTHSTSPLQIGAFASGAYVHEPPIRFVELRTGLDPADGNVLWRFNADDYMGGDIIVDSVTGVTWTLTDPAAVTPPVWSPGTPATIPSFTDSCDSGGLPYAAVEPVLADHEFGNVVTVSNVSQGTISPRAAMVMDVESIQVNDRYMWSPEQLVICNDEFVLPLAEFQLGRRSKAFYRINSFECYPIHDDRLWPVLLSMRMYDSLIVQRTPPESNTITAPMICDGLRIEATPSLMKWVVRCSPGDMIEIVNFWDFANWDQDVWV
jgi:hypothetical protein